MKFWNMMNIKTLKPLLIISTLMCVVLVQGCFSGIDKKSSQSIPVSWQSGFTLPDLLATPAKLQTVDDLKRLIIAPWYADILVRNSKVGESVFSSCLDYFEQVMETTRTVKDNEMGPYLEFKAMCEGARILMSSETSEWNYFPDLILDEDLPSKLPKNIALQTSLEESMRNAKDVTLVHWQDITPITAYEKQSTTKSTYRHNGGYQELEIVGRGDTNNDHVEDVIVVMRDYVEGGDYMNIQILVVSVDKQGGWQLINKI